MIDKESLLPDERYFIKILYIIIIIIIGIALDIINNIDSNKIKMDTINYDHQLIIEINQLNDTVKFIERFSSHQDINNNQALNFIIYYNNLYTYTIPIAINLISNAYLKENGVDKFLSTSFKPFPSYSEFDFGENDKEKIVNTYPEKMRSDYDLILAKIIAFIFFKLFLFFFFNYFLFFIYFSIIFYFFLY
ncbi:hypothetical protein H8356DRAFT_1091463 [Neocallimastix lanati (nom. inval.)]|nr:hypothetical protein H8356DRAFT_1091463 [Neocallimastix sp. JGI-2020a]